MTLREVYGYAGFFSGSDSRWSGFDSSKRRLLQRRIGRPLFRQAMDLSVLLGWLCLRRHTFPSGAAAGFSSVYPAFIFCFYLFNVFFFLFFCFPSLFYASMPFLRFSLVSIIIGMALPSPIMGWFIFGFLRINKDDMFWIGSFWWPRSISCN